MATIYKVLGQSAPSATTATNIYTVPSNTQTIISTIFITNRGSDFGTFSIAVRPAGETLANKHYIAQDFSISPKSFLSITAGITMTETDVLTIEASTANFSFNVYGSEIS